MPKDRDSETVTRKQKSMGITVRTLPIELVARMDQIFLRDLGHDDRMLRLFEGYVHELAHAALLGVEPSDPDMYHEITDLLDIARPGERDAEELTAQAVEVKVLTRLGLLCPGPDGCYELLQILAFNVDGGTVGLDECPDAVIELLEDSRVLVATKQVLRYLRNRFLRGDAEEGPGASGPTDEAGSRGDATCQASNNGGDTHAGSGFARKSTVTPSRQQSAVEKETDTVFGMSESGFDAVGRRGALSENENNMLLAELGIPSSR